MKNLNTVFAMFALVTLSACGSQTMRESVVSANGSVVSTNTGTVTTGSSTGLHAPTEARIELGGNNSGDFAKTLIFKTAKTLRIRVKPLSAPNITVPGYTNWVFPYGCVSVSVTVNGMTRGTQVLRVEGAAQGSTSPCANAPTSQVLDFTDVTTGTGDTQVIYSNANYDNCRYYWPMNYGCGMSAIWQNHRVAIATTTQVDGDWNL